MTLREKLIVLRDKAGISQMALAHQLGVSRQAVSRWESGDATPSMDKLKALAKIYIVTLDWLCNDSDKNETMNEKPSEGEPRERGREPLVKKEKIKGNTYKLTIAIAVAIVIMTLGAICFMDKNRRDENANNTQIEDMEQDKSGSSEEGSFDFEW